MLTVPDGPGDNFDLKNSHVLPALLRKVAQARANNAKQVNVWGTGDTAARISLQ